MHRLRVVLTREFEDLILADGHRSSADLLAYLEIL
jgi:hypothetical protein